MKLIMYMFGIAALCMTTAHAKVKDQPSGPTSLFESIRANILAQHAQRIAATRAKTAEERSRQAQLTAKNEQVEREKEELERKKAQLEEEQTKLRTEHAFLMEFFAKKPLNKEKASLANKQTPASPNRPFTFWQWSSWGKNFFQPKEPRWLRYKRDNLCNH